jgi:hypothetical protein
MYIIFAQETFRPIFLLAYSRLISKNSSLTHEKYNLARKSPSYLIKWAEIWTIFRCTKFDHTHFTMGQNLNFIEKFKTRCRWFWNLWSLGYCRIPITLWHFAEFQRFQNFFGVTSIAWNFMNQQSFGTIILLFNMKICW